MKKRFRRRRFYLIRPADALLPLAFLATDLIGPKMLQGWLFAGWFAVRLFALFSADGVRMAYATQPGMRKVRGSTTLAVILQFMGAALALGLYYLLFHGITPFTLMIIGTGLLLNIEHVFCEYLRAEGDGYGAEMCSVLTAALFFTGVMLDGQGLPEITLALSGVGCLITVLLAAFTGGYRPGKMNVTVLSHAPRAMIGGIIYPAIVIGALYAAEKAFGEASGITETTSMWAEYGLRAGFYGGLALISVMRTPFRRSLLECRAMWPAMGVVCALCAVAGIGAIAVSQIPVHIGAAMICASACVFIASIVIMTMWGSFKSAE